MPSEVRVFLAPEDADQIFATLVGPLEKFNPNHDRRGRFAPRQGGGAALGEQATMALFEVFKDEAGSKPTPALKAMVAQDLAARMSDVPTDDLLDAVNDPNRGDYLNIHDNYRDANLEFGLTSEGDVIGRRLGGPDYPGVSSWVKGGGPEAERLAREYAVSQLVHQWAISSNDDDAHSLCIQHAAARVFKLDEAPWVEASKVTEVRTRQLYQQHGGVYESFVRAQYAATQADFAKRGITSVTVSRGDGLGLIGSVELRPLSSWSADPATASWFGGGTQQIRTAVIPAARILSTPRTGVGCLNESEVVILGGVMGMVGQPHTRELGWAPEGTFEVGDYTFRSPLAKAAVRPLNIDGTVAASDWIKARHWDLPTDPNLVRRMVDTLGGMPKFLTLPAAKAMPPELAAALGVSVAKFNPNHDRRGRFAPRQGGGSLGEALRLGDEPFGPNGEVPAGWVSPEPTGRGTYSHETYAAAEEASWHGGDLNEYADQYRAELERRRENAVVPEGTEAAYAKAAELCPIIHNTDEYSAVSILEKGYIGNQFTEKGSNGVYSPNVRAGAEAAMFGYATDTPGAKRPVYCSLYGGDVVAERVRSHLPIDNDPFYSMDNSYGDVGFVLKSDVKGRATMTRGDSLNTGASATSLLHPNGAALASGYPIPYVETQVHGGVKLSDIAYVLCDNPGRELRKAAAARGFHIVSPATYAQVLWGHPEVPAGEAQARRDFLFAKHMGPGPHPNGTPQAIHSGGSAWRTTSGTGQETLFGSPQEGIPPGWHDATDAARAHLVDEGLRGLRDDLTDEERATARRLAEERANILMPPGSRTWETETKSGTASVTFSGTDIPPKTQAAVVNEVDALLSGYPLIPGNVMGPDGQKYTMPPGQARLHVMVLPKNSPLWTEEDRQMGCAGKTAAGGLMLLRSDMIQGRMRGTPGFAYSGPNQPPWQTVLAHEYAHAMTFRPWAPRGMQEVSAHWNPTTRKTPEAAFGRGTAIMEAYAHAAVGPQMFLRFGPRGKNGLPDMREWHRGSDSTTPYGSTSVDEWFAESFSEWWSTKGKTSNTAVQGLAKLEGWK